MFRKSSLTLLLLAALACGKDGGGGLTDPVPPGPGPVDPGPSDPGADPAPEPVGQVVYAVDLRNNLTVFGTQSFDVLSGRARITGLPILNRVIGIVYRPSDGRLYGVGNDSRVYTIDPTTAAATPVSDQPFEPGIAEFFETHFAMALEPNGNRVRLISTELGGNWSISLDDGTATMGEKVHYAAGDANEGETPRIAAIMFAPPSPVAAMKAGGSLASSSDPCTEVMYMIDPDLASYVGSCDADSGNLGTLGPIGEVWSRCMEAMVDPEGDVIPSEDNPYGFGGGFVWAMRGIEKLNSAGTINPNGTITWHGFTKVEAMQTATIAPRGAARLRGVQAEVHAGAAVAEDPRAHCLD